LARPVVAENEPSAQATHEELVEPWAGCELPIGHSEHEVAPAAVEKEPGAQGEQMLPTVGA
jgi:hypothetical protein